MKTFEEFCDENEDEISEKYVESHFETIGHGGDYDPLDNVNEVLWLEIANDMWYTISGGN